MYYCGDENDLSMFETDIRTDSGPILCLGKKDKVVNQDFPIGTNNSTHFDIDVWGLKSIAQFLHSEYVLLKHFTAVLTKPLKILV
jgi:hypothetical protein